MFGGLFQSTSKSKSTTQSYDTTYAYDQKLAASDSAQAIGVYGSNSSVNIQSMDAEVAKRSFVTADKALTTVEKLGTTIFDVVKAQVNAGVKMNENNSVLLDRALDANEAVLKTTTDLGKTVATGGQSDMNKTLLYVVGAFVALVGLMLFLKR